MKQAFLFWKICRVRDRCFLFNVKYTLKFKKKHITIKKKNYEHCFDQVKVKKVISLISF